MRSTLILSVTMGLLLASPAVGVAAEIGEVGAKYTFSLTQEYTASPWTNEVGYVDRAREKFIFGSKNTLLGWLEMYNEPRDMANQQGNILVGFGHGLKNMVGDTLCGAIQVTTFPITSVDVPLPEGGTDLL